MAEHNDEASQYLSSWRLGLVIFSLFLGTSLIALDTNIINVAIPHIITEFTALQDVSWYGSAYLLTITAFQPIFAVVYKFFSTENTYKVCVLLFEAGSTLCAAAVNSHMFIVGRALAGVGAAGLFQGALCVIGHVVVLQKRPMYMGIVASVFVLSICTGPVLGGFFTTHASWRWCFWINLPCGLVTLVFLQFILKIKNSNSYSRRLPLREKLSHLEPVGCISFLSAVTCLLLALQWGGQSQSWRSATIIGLLIGSFGLFVIFIYVQRSRGEKAMIPLRVLRQRSVWTTACVLFWLNVTIYLDGFYLPFYNQTVQGVDAITSGTRLLPLMIPQIITLILAGAVVSKTGHYVPVMLFGEVVCAVGSGLLITLKPDTPTLNWATFLVVTGIGSGAAMQLPYSAIQAAVRPEDLTVANAIAIFSGQMGAAIAIAAGQTILLNILVDEGQQKLPQVPIGSILAAGATQQGILNFPEPVALVIRQIWNSSITKAFILSVVAVILAIPFTCGMEWLNARNIASDRAKASRSTVSCTEILSGTEEEKGLSVKITESEL